MSRAKEPTSRPARAEAAIAGNRFLLRLSRRVSAAPLGKVLLTTIAGGAFFIITLNVQNRSGLVRHDREWLLDVVGIREGWLTGLAKGVTHLGTEPILYSLFAIAIFLTWRRGNSLRTPVACAVWLVLGQLVRFAVNTAIARPRPPSSLHLVGASGYAFPSGHTTSATIGFSLLAVVAGRLAPRCRREFVAIAVVVAVAVGLSRVYLSVHWPTDVLGGWCLGIAWLSFGALLTNRHAGKGRWPLD